MPATAPQTKPLMRLAMSGRLRRRAYTVERGFGDPRHDGGGGRRERRLAQFRFQVRQATAGRDRQRGLAPISEGMTMPSLPVSAMVWMMVGVKTRCMPVITSRGQSPHDGHRQPAQVVVDRVEPGRRWRCQSRCRRGR